MLKSEVLDQLYKDYNIENLSFGILQDKLGDVYENFVVQTLENREYVFNFQNSNIVNNWEYQLFVDVMTGYNILPGEIEKINATDPVPVRLTHGLSKTDVIMTVNDSKKYPISVKQSTAKKVAFAEFDVDTIIKEVGITDKELIRLLTKHQADASAKNFTKEEKETLTEKLKPIARKFVRWVITGSPDVSNDIRIPTMIVKFDINKADNKLKSYKVFNIEDYIDSIMLDKNGNVKKGGFGTGLSWTYATGSKGRKIQFKA